MITLLIKNIKMWVIGCLVGEGWGRGCKRLFSDHPHSTALCSGYAGSGRDLS